jgi:hypothetical protein
LRGIQIDLCLLYWFTDRRGFDLRLWGWRIWEGIIRGFLVCFSVFFGLLDLERYAEGIGALSKAELRVSRDREVDEGGTRGMRKSVVNQDDDGDDWD